MSAQVQTEVMTITPALAEEYLKHAATNRSISAHTVDRYARDMKGGVWHVTNNAIAFDHEGILLDGEHRLRAITKSGVPVSCLVMRGMTRDARRVVDSGRKRTIPDQWKMEGMFADFWNLNALASAVRAMILEPNSALRVFNLSFNEATEFANRHQDELLFAESCLKGGSSLERRGIYRAAVLALLARASNHVDKHTLQQFGATLISGVVTDECEVTAVRYRDYLKSLDSGARSRGSGQTTRDIYCIGQTALKAYVEQRQLRSLRPTFADLYPLID